MRNLVLILSYLSLSLSTFLYYLIGGSSFYVYSIYGLVNSVAFLFMIFQKNKKVSSGQSAKNLEEYLFKKETKLLIIQVSDGKILKVSKSFSIQFNKTNKELRGISIEEALPELSPDKNECEICIGQESYLFEIKYLELKNSTFYFLDNKSLARERNNEVIELRRQVDELCKFKTHFIDNIAKELRSPLNNIVCMSELLEKSKLDYEQETYVEYIKNSCRQFLSIINDILDFSRIDVESLVLNKKYVRADNFNFDVKNTLITFTRNTRLKISFDEQNLPIYINIDENILRQILSNIIVSSIRATTEGYIRINSSYSNDCLVYELMDSGETKHFDYVSDDEHHFGAGILLIKKLVELMNGNIEIKEDHDKGSFIKLSIPAESLDFVADDINSVDIDFSLKEMNILVVEDNQINSKVIVKILEKAGAIIDTAYNGEDAVLKAKNKSYDVILMDYQLPELNGPDATKKIREFNEGVSIIALTANTLDEDRKICLLAGMNDFISKPVQPSKLVNIIKRNIA